MIYLDSAAVVKLVHAEPESAALRSWLDERADIQWISSVLTEIESFRALARYAPKATSRLPARGSPDGIFKLSGAALDTTCAQTSISTPVLCSAAEQRDTCSVTALIRPA